MSCDKNAVALLTFSAPEAKAWLYDLDQPDPSGGIMLCRKHANATVVPMAWQLVDSRDPAWPGPADPQAEAAVAAASITESVPVFELPNDVSAIEAEFEALQAALPVTAHRYNEPELATARAAGRTISSDLLVDLGRNDAPDPALFELPIADLPVRNL